VSAVATVPAAASVSENHAVVLLFVNQTVNMGNIAPTHTASSVRVPLDKIGGRWLISGRGRASADRHRPVRSHHHAHGYSRNINPPSTERTWPVIQLDSSDSRNASIDARSWG
jgi:hypothetical protein